MDGRTEMRTDRRSPDGRPTSTRRPKDERSTIKRNISFMNHKLYHSGNHLCNKYMSFMFYIWTYNCSIRWLSTFEVSECFRLFRLEMVMVIVNGQACPGWLNLPRERAGRPQGTASQQVTETELRRWRADSLNHLSMFPCSRNILFSPYLTKWSNL